MCFVSITYYYYYTYYYYLITTFEKYHKSYGFYNKSISVSNHTINLNNYLKDKRRDKNVNTFQYLMHFPSQKISFNHPLHVFVLFLFLVVFKKKV